MTDRMQIGFKLALDFLGIPISVENYREICNIALVAKRKYGLPIIPSRVEFNPESGQAYSPISHGDSKNVSWNLYDDLIEMVIGSEDNLEGWTFDEGITKKLEALKADIRERGLGELLREAANVKNNKA